MKNKTIITAIRILSGMKINKVSNPAVKLALLNDYIALKRAIQPAMEAKQEIVEKFQEDFREEIDAVNALRSAGKPVAGHDEYLAAEKDTDRILKQFDEEETEVILKKVSLDQFISSTKESDMSMEQIYRLVGVVVQDWPKGDNE